MPKFRLVVELCAGTAAFSWGLVGARFPVSRMGAKVGYLDAIYGALGMRRHEDAPEACVWVEPDLELARTLALLTTHGGPQAVADVIRGWINCPNGHVEGDLLSERCEECCPDDEPEIQVPGRSGWLSTGKQDARRLWDRLRKERPETSPEREAGALLVDGWDRNGRAYYQGPGCRTTPDPKDPNNLGSFERGTLSARLSALPVARHLVLSASNRLIHATTHPDGRWANTGNGGTRFGGEFATSPEDVAVRCARLLVLTASNRLIPGHIDPDSGRWLNSARPGPNGCSFGGEDFATPISDVADRTAATTPTMPPTSVLCCGAEEVDPAAVLEAYGVEGAEVVVYVDPDYLGRCDDDGVPLDGATTGYLHKFPRIDVRRKCAEWSATGATVIISECVPMAEEMERLHGGQWWSTEITDARIGQRRTFSTARGRTEFLTMNRPPVPRAAWPARDALPGQPSLFGS